MARRSTGPVLPLSSSWATPDPTMHAENDEEKTVSNENETPEIFAQLREANRKGELSILRHHWVPVLPSRMEDRGAALFARADFAKHPDGRRAARLPDAETDTAPWRCQRKDYSGNPTFRYEWASDESMKEQGFLPIIPEIHYDKSNAAEPVTPHVPTSAPPAPWATNTTTEASAAVYALATPSMEVTVGGPLRSRYPADPLPDEGPLKAIVDALGLDWEKFESIEISRTFGITLREEAEHPNPREVPMGARGIRETVWTLLDPDTGAVHVTSTWTIEEER